MIDDRACIYGIGVGRDRNGDAGRDGYGGRGSVEVGRDEIGMRLILILDGELGLSEMGIWWCMASLV